MDLEYLVGHAERWLAEYAAQVPVVGVCRFYTPAFPGEPEKLTNSAKVDLATCTPLQAKPYVERVLRMLSAAEEHLLMCEPPDDLHYPSYGHVGSTRLVKYGSLRLLLAYGPDPAGDPLLQVRCWYRQAAPHEDDLAVAFTA
jgi:hypothetical protein